MHAFRKQDADQSKTQWSQKERERTLYPLKFSFEKMKKELTYIEAYEKLEDLIKEFEYGDVQIDKLADKVKDANELIGICEAKLRATEDEVDGLIKKEI